MRFTTFPVSIAIILTTMFVTTYSISLQENLGISREPVLKTFLDTQTDLKGLVRRV
jgi:hypothetical protein